jgi:chromosomal replication initiator protein
MRSPTTFDQWFAGIQFDDLTDGVLSLTARDEFVLEWVRDHFVPTLTQSIRDMTGWSVQVAWSLDRDLQRPVCERRHRRCVRAPSRSAPSAPPAPPEPPAALRPLQQA